MSSTLSSMTFFEHTDLSLLAPMEITVRYMPGRPRSASLSSLRNTEADSTSPPGLSSTNSTNAQRRIRSHSAHASIGRRQKRSQARKTRRKREITRVGSESDFEIDNTCTICLNLFYRPIFLRNCYHIFCELCIHSLFLNRYDNPGEGGLKGDSFRCPLCRTLVLELPLPAYAIWERIIKDYSPHWSHDRFRNNTKSGQNKWNKHVINNTKKLDWEIILMLTYGTHLTLQYNQFLLHSLPNITFALPVPSIRIHLQITDLLRNKLPRASTLAPQKQEHLELTFHEQLLIPGKHIQYGPIDCVNLQLISSKVFFHIVAGEISCRNDEGNEMSEVVEATAHYPGVDMGRNSYLQTNYPLWDRTHASLSFSMPSQTEVNVGLPCELFPYELQVRAMQIPSEDQWAKITSRYTQLMLNVYVSVTVQKQIGSYMFFDIRILQDHMRMHTMLAVIAKTLKSCISKREAEKLPIICYNIVAPVMRERLRLIVRDAHAILSKDIKSQPAWQTDPLIYLRPYILVFNYSCVFSETLLLDSTLYDRSLINECKATQTSHLNSLPALSDQPLNLSGMSDEPILDDVPMTPVLPPLTPVQPPVYLPGSISDPLRRVYFSYMDPIGVEYRMDVPRSSYLNGDIIGPVQVSMPNDPIPPATITMALLPTGVVRETDDPVHGKLIMAITHRADITLEMTSYVVNRMIGEGWRYDEFDYGWFRLTHEAIPGMRNSRIFILVTHPSSSDVFGDPPMPAQLTSPPDSEPLMETYSLSEVELNRQGWTYLEGIGYHRLLNSEAMEPLAAAATVRSAPPQNQTNSEMQLVLETGQARLINRAQNMSTTSTSSYEPWYE